MKCLSAITAAWSYSRSRTITKSETETSTLDATLQFDNSLQQLENDLRDILDLLARQDMRTIIILEELDKIDEEGETQLDAIIRYFKNFFTQTPALFFFLTDKAYFDLVESKIRTARRNRSYAVEHTFYTHRIFIGRLTTEDCLDYLKQAVADPKLQKVVEKLYAADENIEDEAERSFADFVRVILFRSANHIFDLKNELRQYVRRASPGSTAVSLRIDSDSFPEDQADLAVFQDLIESKTKAFAFGMGRRYANEALRNHLYAVFEEMGSSQPQARAQFYPQAHLASDQSAAAQERGDYEGESLEWDDLIRIIDVVDSMITDLDRGGAILPIDALTFRWKRNPARGFHLERQIGQHELELLRNLARAISDIEPLSGLQGADELIIGIQARSQEIRDSASGLPLEDAEKEREQI